MITLREAESRILGMACPRCSHGGLSAVLHLGDFGECPARCRHCGLEFPVEGTPLRTMEEVRSALGDQLADASCPGCDADDVRFDLQCDINGESCRFVVRCLACAGGFEPVASSGGRVGLARRHSAGEPPEPAGGWR